MIKLEHVCTSGWDAAMRGARNAKNSWKLSDSKWIPITANPRSPNDFRYVLGDHDLNLVQRLIRAGSEHRKFLRDIHVSFDVIAPSFWWAEFDTYKVATTRNSCSKMHKIHVNTFNEDCFSHECCDKIQYAKDGLRNTIAVCEQLRNDFNETGNRDYWRALIELLPESYHMRATWDGSMETVLTMTQQRRHHKLHEEWKPFRAALFEQVPYLREFAFALYGGGRNDE